MKASQLISILQVQPDLEVKVAAFAGRGFGLNVDLCEIKPDDIKKWDDDTLVISIDTMYDP